MTYLTLLNPKSEKESKKIKDSSRIRVTAIFPRIFDSKKEQIRILILGAYTPSKFENMLKNLRECLNKHGFKNAMLVADFPDAPRFHPKSWETHFKRKSFHYIKNWAQILLFVYFKGPNHMGVTRELSYMIDKALEKTDSSAILRDRRLRLSVMIRAEIKDHRILESDFADEQELCQVALGHCRNLVYHLFDTI